MDRAVVIGVVLAVLGVTVLSDRQLGTGFAPARKAGRRTVWQMVVSGASTRSRVVVVHPGGTVGLVAQAMATADPASLVAVLGASAAGAGLLLEP